MNWREEIETGLPPRRAGEPEDLRRKIESELADHLACSLEHELHHGHDEQTARRAVLERFGDPVRIARKLWWDAMKERIMRDRIIIPVLGFASSVLVLFFGGTTPDSRSTLFLILSIILLILIGLFIVKRSIPKFTAWFQAGITFLLSAIFGVLLVYGIIAAVSYASIDTKYASGYSEKAFGSINIDKMSEFDVRKILGQPLRTHQGSPGLVRWYGPPGSWVGEDKGLHTPRFMEPKSGMIQFDLTGKKALWGPWAGKGPDEIRATLGSPIKEKVQRATVYWEYSISPFSGSYHRRWIGFDEQGKVVEKEAYFWRD